MERIKWKIGWARAFMISFEDTGPFKIPKISPLQPYQLHLPHSLGWLKIIFLKYILIVEFGRMDEKNFCVIN
jgi:hypothetical protein